MTESTTITKEMQLEAVSITLEIIRHSTFEGRNAHQILSTLNLLQDLKSALTDKEVSDEHDTTA